MLPLLALTFLIMKLQVGAAKSFSPDGRQYLFLKRVPETNFVRNYILHTNGCNLLIECLALCNQHGETCKSGLFVPRTQTCFLYNSVASDQFTVNQKGKSKYFMKASSAPTVTVMKTSLAVVTRSSWRAADVKTAPKLSPAAVPANPAG
ncbi:hypothetical protein EB796_000776 [Bugula neritina]|uniref:Apple domain-containing protein n=1 Tax=Bugula neritina TaxID=10212 RepID=A0A7J7KS54_BUGNE|nr:hypothetical protein EB796_000776 [Bugula neritina]